MPDSLARFIPDFPIIAAVLAPALLHGGVSAAIASWLRVRRGVRAPYTRKTFHFLILSGATAVQLVWGVAGVVVYGCAVVALVVGAAIAGDENAFYEALARPTDSPRRTLFIIVPLITTAVGGVLTNLLFPAWAPVGYMAVAWGDAVGEPVGTRWGRHRYRVPSLGGVPAVRSLEGSAAVFVASWLACGGILAVSGTGAWSAVWAGLVIGAVAAAVESVSHHGLDNLTIQLAAAGAAALLLG